MQKRIQKRRKLKNFSLEFAPYAFIPDYVSSYSTKSKHAKLWVA